MLFFSHLETLKKPSDFGHLRADIWARDLHLLPVKGAVCRF